MRIEEVINSYLIEKRESEKRDNTKFRISDAGRCRLMRYWKRQGRPFSDEHDARVLRIFEVSTMIHKWLQDILQAKGILEAVEFRVEDEHRLGHVDAIVRTESGLILYDFKTVNSRKFHYKKENGFDDVHHAMQAVSYAMMLPFQVSDVRIVYVSKDDLQIEEVSVLNFEGIFEKTKEDWEILIRAWIENSEPEPNPLPWECQYCVYKSICLLE